MIVKNILSDIFNRCSIYVSREFEIYFILRKIEFRLKVYTSVHTTIEVNKS